MINNIILTSLFCLGFYKAFDEGMIFGWLREWLVIRTTSVKNYPENISWFYKPLFDCPPCMASFWGLLSFIGFYHCIDWRVIPFIFCVSGLNWLLSSIADR